MTNEIGNMKPREKLSSYGADVLSAEELLTIMIGSGTSGLSAQAIAHLLLEYAGGSLRRVSEMTPAELRSVKGIGQATAVSISAAFELARRAERESISSPFINSPEDIYNALKTDVAHLDHEEFWALHISSSGRLLSRQKVSQGGLSSASVDQRMIFRQCYALGSSSIALCHNHPSGSLAVSDKDVEITHVFEKSCRILGFSLMDHVIIARGTYVSLLQRGLL